MPTGTRNPYTPGVTKIELLWTQDGVPAANVLYSSYTGGPPTEAECGGSASNIVNGWWTDVVRGYYTNATIFVGVRVTDMASSTGAEATIPAGTAGTNDGGAVPAGCALLANYSIARRYRGGHPRTYFPPPANSYLSTASSWAGGIITDFNAAIVTLLASTGGYTVGSTTWVGPVCVSYQTGNAWRVANLVEPLSGLTVDPGIKTQRRRYTASSY